MTLLVRTSLAVAVIASVAPASAAEDLDPHGQADAPAPSTASDGTAPAKEGRREVPRPQVGSGSAPSSELAFDLLGQPAQKPDPALQASLERRRSMLSLHPALGLATWAALAATTIVGQLDFDDRFRGGGDTGKYHAWHRGLAIGTSALFGTTALLALLAPKPFDAPARLDTALLHKIAMTTAKVGMVAQLVLGIVARGQAGSLAERRIATAHQIIGYGTLAAFSVGVVVFVF